MNLETALQIIQDQYEYTCKFYGDTEGYDFTNGNDADAIDEVFDIGMDESKLDPSKIHVRLFESVGGYEGGGEYASRVLGINHPEHGIAFVKYDGNWDSWNGGDWNEPRLVEGREVLVMKFFDIK